MMRKIFTAVFFPARPGRAQRLSGYVRGPPVAPARPWCRGLPLYAFQPSASDGRQSGGLRRHGVGRERGVRLRLAQLSSQQTDDIARETVGANNWKFKKLPMLYLF